MKLSIITPSFRQDKIDGVYNSINVDFDWEFIVVSPHQITPYLATKNNVKWNQDFGSPVRASCIGSSMATGEIITHGADDCLWNSEVLKKCVAKMDESEEEKAVVVAKYYEGSKVLQNDDYYKIVNAYVNTPFIDKHWVIFNTMFMRRSYFQLLGGWSCEFEVSCIAHCDLSIRAQMDLCSVYFVKEALLECEHGCPNHKPIEDAQNNHDTPLLKEIYNSVDCVNRIRIRSDNWKTSPEKWTRRFK